MHRKLRTMKWNQQYQLPMKLGFMVMNPDFEIYYDYFMAMNFYSWGMYRKFCTMKWNQQYQLPMKLGFMVMNLDQGHDIFF